MPGELQLFNGCPLYAPISKYKFFFIAYAVKIRCACAMCFLWQCSSYYVLMNVSKKNDRLE